MGRQKEGASTQAPNLLSFTHIRIMEEDRGREDGVLKEQGHNPSSAKSKFAQAIAHHPRLSPGQKEQALYFLCGPVYPKNGYAIARNYIRLCLSPDYTKKKGGHNTLRKPCTVGDFSPK